jgi:hypothetical protein
VIAKAEGQLLITGVPLEIMKVAVWLVVPMLLEALSVTLLVPTVVGVPLIRPLVEICSPTGRLEALKVIGAVPLAVKVLLNATPTVPLKEFVEVKVGDCPEEKIAGSNEVISRW